MPPQTAMPQLSSRMPPQFPPQPPHPGPVDGFTSTDATTQMWRRHPDRDYPPALGTQSYYQQHDYGGGPDYFHDHPRDPSFLSRASTFLSNYIHCIMARRIVRTIVKVGVLVTVTISFLLYLDSHFRAVHEHVHAILPEHHDGIIVTDIAYLECNTINLVKTCAMDATQGWNRVEKDLYLGSGWTKTGYLYVQTKKEGEFKPETDKIVVDIKIGRKTPEPKDGAGDNNVMWEQRQLGLWVKRQKKLMQNTVTAVEVLYGPDAVEVREGWQLKDGSLNVGDLGLQPRLTICRGNPPKPVKPLVQLDKNHNLKIIQVADLHLSTGVGLCRDPEPDSGLSGCEADPRTLDFIRRILDDEKPQLAVLTGDQINGDSTKDIQTTLFKFAELFISRRIPFATILGNHDDEGAMTRKQIMELTASLPYSLSEVGPELGPMVKDTKGREIPEGGVGNYLVEVVTHNRVEHPALSLYFLDSHSYTTAPKEKGYGWIENSQIDWFKNKVKAVKAAHDKYIYMHLNMAFIHIPLPEYRLTGLPIVGEKREAIMAPTHNTGFKDALVAAEVGVVSVGHDHANDFCMLDQLWMCYAGGAGFGGYGGYNNYIRRVRIFQIDGDRNEIVTWKRIQHGDKNALKNRLDRQILVKDGKPVVPPPGTVSV